MDQKEYCQHEKGWPECGNPTTRVNGCKAPTHAARSSAPSTSQRVCTLLFVFICLPTHVAEKGVPRKLASSWRFSIASSEGTTGPPTPLLIAFHIFFAPNPIVLATCPAEGSEGNTDTNNENSVGRLASRIGRMAMLDEVSANSCNNKR